jgi:hypothetical protein
LPLIIRYRQFLLRARKKPIALSAFYTVAAGANGEDKSARIGR